MKQHSLANRCLFQRVAVAESNHSQQSYARARTHKRITTQTTRGRIVSVAPAFQRRLFSFTKLRHHLLFGRRRQFQLMIANEPVTNTVVQRAGFELDANQRKFGLSLVESTRDPRN
jgi:hypothetical protein